MRELPAIDDRTFPRNARLAIAWFWAKYWMWFFLFLPWMLMRQVFISGHQLLGALWTWNRAYRFLDGALHIQFMNNLFSLPVTAIFGERFTAIQYRDVLIDPGPVFGRRRLERHLDRTMVSVQVVVATHAHEEHIGNTGLAARKTAAPVFATAITLQAIRAPEQISFMRRTFIGQPESVLSADLRPLPATLETPATCLTVIESPGHCAGHASLFDAEQGILFAGDSFMHTVFTSPNQDVSTDDWIATLERYSQLPIRTMVGAHGYIETKDDRFPVRAFVVSRSDPAAMLAEKCAFLKWARQVVAEGEARGLPYSVIEACLFPWQGWWSWHNWFGDESGRLFSAGEFSRTYFVRSLSRTPERVPPRFPPFARLAARIFGRKS